METTQLLSIVFVTAFVALLAAAYILAERRPADRASPEAAETA
jgi:hypothetical protein